MAMTAGANGVKKVRWGWIILAVIVVLAVSLLGFGFINRNSTVELKKQIAGINTAAAKLVAADPKNGMILVPWFDGYLGKKSYSDIDPVKDGSAILIGDISLYLKEGMVFNLLSKWRGKFESGAIGRESFDSFGDNVWLSRRVDHSYQISGKATHMILMGRKGGYFSPIVLKDVSYRKVGEGLVEFYGIDPKTGLVPNGAKPLRLPDGRTNKIF